MSNLHLNKIELGFNANDDYNFTWKPDASGGLLLTRGLAPGGQQIGVVDGFGNTMQRTRLAQFGMIADATVSAGVNAVPYNDVVFGGVGYSIVGPGAVKVAVPGVYRVSATTCIGTGQQNTRVFSELALASGRSVRGIDIMSAGSFVTATVTALMVFGTVDEILTSNVFVGESASGRVIAGRVDGIELTHIDFELVSIL